jgi:hypothetical protein
MRLIGRSANTDATTGAVAPAAVALAAVARTAAARTAVTRTAFAFAAFALAAVALPALAHHSGAMFEDRRTLELTGTVARFDYVNPHSWLYVNVENEDGTVTEWGFELDAPPRLRRIGVSPNHWREGDRVVVRTRPLKDGRPAGFLVGAVSDQGRTFGQAQGLALGD